MEGPAAEKGLHEGWAGGAHTDLLSLGDSDQTTPSPGVLIDAS